MLFQVVIARAAAAPDEPVARPEPAADDAWPYLPRRVSILIACDFQPCEPSVAAHVTPPAENGDVLWPVVRRILIAMVPVGTGRSALLAWPQQILLLRSLSIRRLRCAISLPERSCETAARAFAVAKTPAAVHCEAFALASRPNLALDNLTAEFAVPLLHPVLPTPTR